MLGKNGSVVLFFSGLPETVTHRDLKSLLKGMIKRGWWGRFLGQGKIGSCNILRIRDLETDRIEYHGQVEIEPATFALQVIRVLNGTTFHGQKLVVNRYNHRIPARDRRKHTVDGNGDRKRLRSAQSNDRRRHSLSIGLVETAPARLRLSFNRRLLHQYQ